MPSSNSDVLFEIFLDLAMQGQSPSLVESAQKSLSKAGVSVRTALVEKVSAGRSVETCKDLGKKVNLKLNGKSVTEESDLVLWTAGVL